MSSKMIETYRGAVYPWHCDHMGHMNVMWYVGKFDEATWNFFAKLGITPKFMLENKRGMVAVHQEISYKTELLSGDVVVIHSATLEVKDKSLRFIHEMRNAVTDEVSSITILTGVHLDKEKRKASNFPDEVRKQAESLMIPDHFVLKRKN